MKKLVLTLIMAFLAGTLCNAKIAQAYSFGDFRSETLAGKAWEALSKNDVEAVLAYTNKCMELYGEQAKKMQADLQDYPKGKNQEIFAFWALNDVATSLFIQGEAYRNAKMNEEAKEVYNKLINEYKYGQAWDPKGWFWKPAEAAKEKLNMLVTGSKIDFGDYTSSFLASQAWKALAAKDVDSVNAYVAKIVELYGPEAGNMQASLTEYPWESKDKIFSFWALNDVGTALYIQAEAYKTAGKKKEAKDSYSELVNEYFYAQCWDPQGWFWKPAEAAQQALDELGEI